MSWQAWAFALLAVVLAGGIAWYERSRPSARTVALVAALAALAVAGRLVFAPVPNLVATTDVAVITGYALGGAPGFAVGALAAPISNLWLGQGPWTPWQMAGWGLCGLAGAGLAFATRRRLGRLGLASACALAGLAYGALLDLSVMVSYGGEQSLDRYLALSARGIPFNVVHAAGNFALALAAGPALVRMISRFRERLTFTWSPATAVSLLVALALSGAAIAPPGADAAGVADARSYLEHQQNPDGGFGATSSAASNVDMTAWAMLGIEASGRNPLDVRRSGRSPVAYLRSRAASISSTSDLEKTILALAGAGVSTRSFEGTDLVAQLRAERSRNGSFASYVDLTAFAVFALRAGGAPASELRRSTSWLRRAQNPDGGWGTRAGSASTTDSTGSALGALALTGGGEAASRAVAFLRRAQSGDGGFASPGLGTNTQTTAWAVQALVAAGVDPAAVTSGGRSPFDYLRARQASDGHYRYSASSDQTPIWVTGQALMAASRRAFPVPAIPRSSEPGGLPDAGGDPAGSSGGGDAGRDPRSGGAGGRTGERRGGHARGREARAGQGSGSATPTDRRRAELAASRLPGEEVRDPGGAEPEGARSRYLLGALALLAICLGAGFAWYRRRLP